jgi:hypothetical protein
VTAYEAKGAVPRDGPKVGEEPVINPARDTGEVGERINPSVLKTAVL